MKRCLCLIVSTLLALNIVTSCTTETSKSKKEANPIKAKPALDGFTGTVIETINTSGYTYVQVDTGKEKIWAAATEFQVKVGDKVTVPQGMLMKNHHSKTLNRTFDLIYFVAKITVAGTEQTTRQFPKERTGVTHGKTVASAPADIDFSGIIKPKGGKTIAELYAQKGDLSGKEVVVRGKVVKFSSKIMGKNWIHVQDGTGDKGTNDLTITTSAVAKVGDIVVVSGVVVTNKDFGYGYKYDIIIEDAKITVE
jgi:sporulation protein YlmC with PRC-barrel domain